MFDNIGGKIKTLAKVVCWLGIIASVIVAIVMFVASKENYRTEGTYVGLGIAFLIGGPLISWISSFMCYGFGELIENSAIIARNTTASKNYISSDNNQTETNTQNKGMHKWRCSNCGAMIETTPCPNCGHQPSENRNATLDELLKSGLISQEEYDTKVKMV